VATDRSPSLGPSPSASAAGWTQLCDLARGTRRLRLDDGGRIAEHIDATGARLAFRHDENGSLKRIEQGDWFVDIKGEPRSGGFSVTDPEGKTSMRFGPRGRTRTIRRGGASLAIEMDELERVSRVRLPGSGAALLYNWSVDGDCKIFVEGGRRLLTITVADGARRVRLDKQNWFDEMLRPSRAEFSVTLAGMPVEQLTMKLDDRFAMQELRWGDGAADIFERDEARRLTQWTRCDGQGNSRTYGWRFAGDHLVTDDFGEREVDAGGRTCSRADGTVQYDYDSAGRRIAHEDATGKTHYSYDPMGNLLAVTLPDGRVRGYHVDGMGRRTGMSLDGAVNRHEHRDETGRLWAVTDGEGKPLHVYIWLGDRIVARIDGKVGDPIVEAYLCDPFGTPHGALVADGKNWRFERLETAPYGAVNNAARPTIYGHFSDAITGLIHFGARDLDPVLGLFLTPDPWHGGEDDPRRWAGASSKMLQTERERPEAGFHDYALCRFDPLGRLDRDGHLSAGDVLLHILRWTLLPTWGFPLTSISIFFFQPINLYMEVVALIIWSFKATFCEDKSHPWGYHTIASMTGLLGSARQFTFAFGLNGFLPRVVAGGGINADRAVTVGNVVWINSEELSFLGRPEVLLIEDIQGGTAGHNRFNDTANVRSVVALNGKNDDGEEYLHFSAWTRGLGNAVTIASGKQRFVDIAVSGGAARSGIHLRQPIPYALPAPIDDDDDETLKVIEFTRSGGDPEAILEEVTNSPRFWLKLPKDTSFAAGDVIRISMPEAPDPKPDPAFIEIREKFPADDHAALLLDVGIPSRIPSAALSTELQIDGIRAVAGATASSAWNTGGSATKIERSVATGVPPADFPPSLSKGQIIRVNATTPATGEPASGGLLAGPVRGTQYAIAIELSATLSLERDAGGIAAGAQVRLRVPDGALFHGKVTAIAEPGKITLDTPHPDIEEGDLLVMRKAADRICVRVTADPDDHVVTIDPPVPASMAGADGTRIDLQSTRDSAGDGDEASVTSVSGSDVTVSTPRGRLFAAGNLIRFEAGGQVLMRTIGLVPKMEILLSDPPLGTGPFTIQAAQTRAGRRSNDVSLAPPTRFLRHVSGALPSTFGDWPANIVGFVPNNFSIAVEEQVSAYCLKWSGNRPGVMKEEFHKVWSVVSQGGTEFVVLETPLPLLTKDGQLRWRADSDDDDGQRDITLGSPPATQKFKMQEFGASGAQREDASSQGRVLLAEAEVLVPDDPSVHDTHRRALIEHEIHHTVQCNFWGPLMNALPLSGVAMVVADIIAASGEEIPDWLKQVDRDANGEPPDTADGRINNNTEINPFQVFSIGGLMQLAWKYVFMGPFLGIDEISDDIQDLDFEDFNRVVNPVSRLITQNLPQVDSEAEPGERWLTALGQVFSKALDLRSWQPMTGFVPTLLPDGPQNFIEQGASRASGDLYSTILTANDHYNLISKGRLFGSHEDRSADLHAGLGRAVRLLMFCGGRLHRVLKGAASNIAEPLIGYRRSLDSEEPVSMKLPDPGKTVILPGELYRVERPSGTGTARTFQLQGPAPARRTIDYVEAHTGDTIYPRLRAYVPLPPRVNRTLGFYMIAGSPAKIEAAATTTSMIDVKLEVDSASAGASITLEVSGPELPGSPITVAPVNVVAGQTPANVAREIVRAIRGDITLSSYGVWARRKDAEVEVFAPRVTRTALSWTVNTTGTIDLDDETGLIVEGDPQTDRVTITVEDEVRVDNELVPWTPPIEIPPAATPPIPHNVDRFQTELCTLRVKHPEDMEGPDFEDVGIDNLKLDFSETSIDIGPLAENDGWSLRMPAAVPGSSSRLRIFRTIAKDDPGFDLMFADEPGLDGTRSYLDGDIFVVVRDSQLTVQPLPEISDAEIEFDESFELTLPIKLEQGEGAITIVPPAGIDTPPVERIDEEGREDKWQIGPMEDAPSGDIVYRVTVTYGKVGATVDKSFNLTFKAAIKLAAASDDIVPGMPLEINISRGTGPYEASLDPEPDGLEITQPSANKIVLLANAAPEDDMEITLTVEDDDDHEAVRHFTLKSMPPMILPNDDPDHLDYMRPATRGLATPLINGRSSGGAGPDVDLTEPLDEMELAVAACGAGDAVYLSAWFFDPATPLTVSGIAGDTWGKLLARKTRNNVIIRLLINDFDPISGMDNWLENTGLTPLNAVIAGLPANRRDNLKYQVAMHPATVGRLKAALAGQGFREINVASHHQKFMIVRRGDSLTAFCGGLDLESRKAPASWSYATLAGWHDLHVKLEGPITRDLEREFVMRWNAEREEEGRPLRAGWSAMEELSTTPLSPADDTAARKVHLMQMLRTISVDGTVSTWDTKRNDIKEVYRRAIKGARKFLYLENQYFRDTDLADWIVAAGNAHPALHVIMVVVNNAGADDGANAITDHGNHLQHETFERIADALGRRASFYTMHRRAVHSKFMLVDDTWMTIGSANVNVRSFELDSELNVQIADGPLAKSFRHRLWAHNLGRSEATVAGWSETDFIAEWNSVATTNSGRGGAAMEGEGVIQFEYSSAPGVEHGSIPDGLTQLDFDTDGDEFIT